MTDPPTRRHPRTQRGQQRVRLILDAAADMLVEMGYAALTTNHIAARADISIGSLYQYFKNKDCVLEALADRYLDDLNNVLDVYFADHTDTPLPDVMAAFVDGTLTFYEDNPGFEPLFFGAVKTEALEEIGAQTYSELVRRVAGVFRAHLPDDAPCDLYAQMVVSVCKLQIPHRHNIDAAHHAAYISEVKTMVRTYVSAIIAA